MFDPAIDPLVVEELERFKSDDESFNRLVALFARLFGHGAQDARRDLTVPENYQFFWNEINDILVLLLCTPISTSEALEARVHYVNVSRERVRDIPNLGNREKAAYREFVERSFADQSRQLESSQIRKIARSTWPHVVKLLKRFPTR